MLTELTDMKFEQSTVLLVGDDPKLLEKTRLLLSVDENSPDFAIAGSGDVLSFLEQHDVSLIIFEMTPELNSGGLLEQICSQYRNVRVIVVTDSVDVEMAVNSVKAGAFDYLARPFDRIRLVNAVETARHSKTALQKAASLKEYLLNDHLEHAEAFSEIKTTCRKMRSIFQYTEVVACSPQAVLITGETGVGKELFARAIHRISKVRGQFVSINVAGLDDAMFSDTLFGHKKGAFTGADQYRDGLVQKASLGTLFLDEIGDLNELSQVKLLRLLQEQEYYPVGADQVKTSSARIVLATNVNLQERIREGRFRRDLYYRLCSHQVNIPALRERQWDIPLLVDGFVREAALHFGKPVPVVSPELLKVLTEYDFPGNVRELRAKISDAVVRSAKGELTLDDFPEFSSLLKQTAVSQVESTADLNGVYCLFGRLPTFREIEDYLLVEAMNNSKGNYAVAASMLGVTRQTISKRLKSI